MRKMVASRMTLMKTSSNKKTAFKEMIVPLFVIVAFVIITILIFKKTEENEVKDFFSQKIIIDTVSDSRALGYSGQRKIVKDNKGNIFVGYRKEYEKNTEIFVAKIFQDIAGFHISGIESPIAVIGKNNDQRVPSLAVDRKNTVHVVWYGSNTENTKNNRQIKYVRKPASAKDWESWRNISYVSGYDGEEFWQEHPMIFVGKNNKLYVVWEGKDQEHQKQQIKFSKSTNEGTIWTKWKNIAPLESNTQSRPTLIEDQNGKLFVFSYSSEGNEDNLQQVQYSSSSDEGDNWSGWQSISNPAFDARHISVAVDEFGKLHIVWRAQITSDGPTQIIYRTFFNDSWSDIQIVSPSENYQFFPNIGINNTGEIYVSWAESADPSEFPHENPTGGKGVVSFLKKGIFQPPTSLSDQNNLLYLNVSEKIDSQDFVPIFYEEQLNEKEFNLNLKFLDSSK